MLAPYMYVAGRQAEHCMQDEMLGGEHARLMRTGLRGRRWPDLAAAA